MFKPKPKYSQGDIVYILVDKELFLKLTILDIDCYSDINKDWRYIAISSITQEKVFVLENKLINEIPNQSNFNKPPTSSPLDSSNIDID